MVSKAEFRQRLEQGFMILDGGGGTLLQAAGLPMGKSPESWNLERPELILDMHRQYLLAGAQLISTNTFGANRLKFANPEEIIQAAVKIARQAIAQAEQEGAPGPHLLALNIGPSGQLLAPLGQLDFEDAVELFAQQVRAGVAAGVDAILIETMSDGYEAKAALLAAKEHSDLPLLITTVYDEHQRLLSGGDPATMATMLSGLGADAIGINCSLGPAQMLPIVQTLREWSNLPLIVNPNAGLPLEQDGRTTFPVGPAEFAAEMRKIAQAGGHLLGGCCGTTPAHIRAMVEALADLQPLACNTQARTTISSHQMALELGKKPLLIGERINPTGKKRMKQALREGDLNYLLEEGLKQQSAGVHILDVNVGLPEIDEQAVMLQTMLELQRVSPLPLQIDTASPAVMTAALRRYHGKALINSVNGKAESMEAIFPLVKHYGGVVIALTLDENGIPATAEGRLAIAKHIVATAAHYGIAKEDIVFDPLTLAISAEEGAGMETLRAIRLIKEQLGCAVSLGVSNVSFGLPSRESLTATFFAMALECGLDAAIMNPFATQMLQVYYSALALKGYDPNCSAYIDFCSTLPAAAATTAPAAAATAAPPAADAAESGHTALFTAICKGLHQQAGAETMALLAAGRAGLEIIDRELVPALDVVGRDFESGKAFLPQLLMSADAAKAAFDCIRADLASRGERQGEKATVVLATVQGDIHDIGKNIVRALLENYGFQVVDLGKDVPPAEVVAAAQSHNAPLVGLSALMTTTVVSMEETIAQLRAALPAVKVVVGGAVLTADYAARIGADHYAKDAMETVRYAETFVPGEEA